MTAAPRCRPEALENVLLLSLTFQLLKESSDFLPGAHDGLVCRFALSRLPI